MSNINFHKESAIKAADLLHAVQILVTELLSSTAAAELKAGIEILDSQEGFAGLAMLEPILTASAISPNAPIETAELATTIVNSVGNTRLLIQATCGSLPSLRAKAALELCDTMIKAAFAAGTGSKASPAEVELLTEAPVLILDIYKDLTEQMGLPAEASSFFKSWWSGIEPLLALGTPTISMAEAATRQLVSEINDLGKAVILLDLQGREPMPLVEPRLNEVLKLAEALKA